MSQLKSVVIGLGAIHQNHLHALSKIPETTLSAVCDIDPELLLSRQEKLLCEGFTDYREMIDTVHPDVVHICTPHYLHAPMAIYAMEHGCHVLTEKPMAIHEEETRQMIETASKTGKTLGICFQNRYNPTSQRIRALLDSGEAGKVLSIKMTVTWNRDEKYYGQAAWRGTWSMEGGGVLINQAIHTLDLMLWYAGEVESVQAQASSFRLGQAIEVEDTAHGYIHFKNGATGIFYATNAFGADSPIELDIICEHAHILLKNDLDITFDDGRTEHMTNTSLVSGSKGYWGNGHDALIRDYYDHILQGKPFPIDGTEAAKVIHLIQGIYHSAGISPEQ